MQVKAEGMLLSYGERKSKDGLKVYRSVELHLKGREPGALKLNVPDDSLGLVQTLQASEYKPARAVIEIRQFAKTGQTFLDLVGLELVK